MYRDSSSENSKNIYRMQDYIWPDSQFVFQFIYKQHGR